jgi:hypothetical protein
MVNSLPVFDDKSRSWRQKINQNQNGLAKREHTKTDADGDNDCSPKADRSE